MVENTTLSSPVIFKQRFIYQSETPTIFVVSEIVTVDKWFATWREPVWPKKGPPTELQQFYTADTIPIPTSKGMGWYAPWREPVWPKKGLSAKLQQFYAGDTQPVPTSKGMGWFNPLSEPYPFKRGLKAPYQQFFTTDPRWIPDPSRFLSGWYNWLSEPKRFPVGLKAWLQQTTSQTLIPATLFPAVTITISAVETNADTITAAIVVFQTPPATVEPRALVSVVEVQVPQNSPYSIWEN